MSVMPYATVVGVFSNSSDADLAVKALLKAGFEEEKIRCFQESSGVSLLDAFKSMLTGLSPDEERLIRKLTDMKLTEEEALYFSDEYERGSTILAVKTQGDDPMAVNILHQYGARP